MSRFAFNCDNGKRAGVCPSRVRLGEVKFEPMQKQLNILVVEDTQMLMAAIQHGMERKGWGSVGACNIPDALKLARSGQKFDAITLDFDLGNGTNGTHVFWGLPEELRERVVFFTGERDEGRLSLIEKTGRPIVPKPQMELLLEAIREIASSS